MLKKIPWICTLIFVGIVTGFAQQPQTQIQPPKPPAEGSRKEEEFVELLLLIKTAEVETKLYVSAPESNKDKAGATSRLAALYARAAKNPQVTNFLVGEALSDFYNLKEGARGAAQVSQAADEAGIKFQSLTVAQNQTLIEQNLRIINLLEQLVRKR